MPSGEKSLDSRKSVRDIPVILTTMWESIYEFILLYANSVPGINTPEISLPAYNPPVPNRAWTAMRAGVDIDALTDEERRELYVGRDGIL